VMQNLDDPNYDATKLPAQVQQMFRDFRAINQTMDPNQAGTWRQQMMMEFLPVIQRNQVKFQKAMQMAFLLDLKEPLGATTMNSAPCCPHCKKSATPCANRKAERADSALAPPTPSSPTNPSPQWTRPPPISRPPWTTPIAAPI